MTNYKKEFAFDLKADRYSPLYDYYDSLSSAYNDIKKYMLNNGFLWRQGSVYISEKPLTNRQVRNVIVNMCEELPWLSECLNKFDVTNIGTQHNLLNDIDEACIEFNEKREQWKNSIIERREEEER